MPSSLASDADPFAACVQSLLSGDIINFCFYLNFCLLKYSVEVEIRLFCCIFGLNINYLTIPSVAYIKVFAPEIRNTKRVWQSYIFPCRVIVVSIPRRAIGRTQCKSPTSVDIRSFSITIRIA